MCHIATSMHPPVHLTYSSGFVFQPTPILTWPHRVNILTCLWIHFPTHHPPPSSHSRWTLSSNPPACQCKRYVRLRSAVTKLCRLLLNTGIIFSLDIPLKMYVGRNYGHPHDPRVTVGRKGQPTPAEQGRPLVKRRWKN